MDDTRPIGGVKGKKTKKQRGLTPRMTYWAFVLGIAMLLSALVIGAANDIFAFKKADYTAVITIPEN
ncbi:MAG: hypothetical protein RR994_03730, partial [Clostridia bacterium]